MPAFQMASIRQFIGGICFILFFMFYKKLTLPNTREFIVLLVLSLLMFVGNNGLGTWSLKYIPTGLSSLIGALYPLCVVLIELIFFKNKDITMLTIVGMLLGIGGIGIVFYENAFHEQPDGYGFGVMLGFIGMIAWSIGTIFVARNKYNINPYYAMGWQMFISSFLIYAMALATNNHIPYHEIPFQTWASITYLITMGSVIAFMAFIYSIKYLPPAIASLYAYINPLVAMITGAILLHEPLTFNIIIGAIITLGGVYLVNFSLKKK